MAAVAPPATRARVVVFIDRFLLLGLTATNSPRARSFPAVWPRGPTLEGVRSVLLDRPGAVAGRTPDDLVAGHYGDPLREQRALLADGGVVDRSHRGVITVSGPDRLTWLH